MACAGSLDKLYNETLGPDFAKATGDKFGGPPCAGSSTLAQEITSKAISVGVFLAVGASPIETLWPTRSKFAISLATDPLVVAYSSHSRYAKQLDAIRNSSKPLSALFPLMMTSGFRLGRTDPTQDPQGGFFILMMMLAQKQLHLASGAADNILGITSSAPFGSAAQQVSEDALPTDIATGVVDAGSEYVSQAIQYGLRYIPLPATLDFASPAEESVYATVSITVAGAVVTGKLITLNTTLVLTAAGSPMSTADQAANDAFVAYLLSNAGQGLLKKAGYTLAPPVIDFAPGTSTAAGALPPAVLSAFQAIGGTTAAG